MNQPENFELTINGSRPELLNAICEGFVCESLHIEGQAPASANVTYLKFGGTWYRLYFEFRCIFWRRHGEEELPWSSEHPWTDYADLANTFKFAGQRLVSCTEMASVKGSEVAFVFEQGLKVSIKDSDDRTSFEVTNLAPPST